MLDAHVKSIIVLCLSGILCASSIAEAQNGYIARNVTTPAPEGFFTVPAPAVCRDGTGQTLPSQSLPDGGFVPPSKSIRVDVSNVGHGITGICEFWSNNQLLDWWTRYLNAFKIASAGTWNTLSPSNWVQEYDSRTVLGGYSTWTVGSTPGAQPFDFQAWGMSTNCNIPNLGDTSTKTINIVKCGPRFTIDSNTNITRMPGGQLSIYVPPTMSLLYGPVDRAALDWTNALTSSGITLTRVPNPCSGGSCINVQEGTVPVDACSEYTKYPDPNTGINVLPAEITFPSGWGSRPDDRLQRTIAHELGHLFGLNDQAGVCQSADSVMVVGLPCNGTGYNVTPTLTDTIAVNKAPYGGGARTSCGF